MSKRIIDSYDLMGVAGSGENIISVKEARKILGKDALPLSDDEVQKLIITMTKVAGGLFSDRLVPNTSKV